MIVDNEAMQAYVRKYVASLADAIHDEAWEIAVMHTSHNETNDDWHNHDLEEVKEAIRKELKHFI
tara:strand:+ start:2184 stop:2378 length:195 start_codon:yes stop_codon:yes gene_type:complete